MLATGKGPVQLDSAPLHLPGATQGGSGGGAGVEPPNCHREKAGVWHVPACDNRGRERVERRCK